MARTLAQELAAGRVSSAVELFLEVKNFVNVSLRPAAEALAEIRGRLIEDSEFRVRLKQAIDDAIARLLVDEHWAEYELEEAFLHAVSPGVTHIAVVSARSLDDEEVLLDLIAEGDANIEFRARRASGGWPAGNIDEFDEDNPAQKDHRHEVTDPPPDGRSDLLSVQPHGRSCPSHLSRDAT